MLIFTLIQTSVVRLVKSGHDITVACYPKKVVMWDQAAKAVKNGDDRDMSMLLQVSSLISAHKIAVQMDLLKFWMDPQVSWSSNARVFKT